MQFFIDKRFWSFQKLFEIDCMLYYTLHGDTNDIKKKSTATYTGVHVHLNMSNLSIFEHLSW